MTDGTFTMKIDPETEGKLEALAKETERNKSEMVRHLINAEAKRILMVQHADGRVEVDSEVG